MKYIRLVLSISILFIINDAYGQKRLTNRQIYNFNVGDVIHTSYTYKSSPTFVKRRFLSKIFTITQDTVKFVVIDSIYTFQSPGNWKITINTDTIIYMSLDSFPEPFDQLYNIKSYQVSDTGYKDSCGIVLNKIKFTNAPDTLIILDREWYYLSLMEGLGSYYEHQYQNNTQAYYKLLYYKKSGKECGTKIGYLTIKGLKALDKINIFPNPVKDELIISFNFPLKNLKIEITNLTGQIVYKSDNSETLSDILIFDMSKYTKGFYNLMVINDKEIFKQKFIKLD